MLNAARQAIAGRAGLIAARSGRSRWRSRRRSGTPRASSSGRGGVLDRDRDLLGGDAALDRLDHELGGVELLLAQNQLRQDGGADAR